MNLIFKLIVQFYIAKSGHKPRSQASPDALVEVPDDDEEEVKGSIKSKVKENKAALQAWKAKHFIGRYRVPTEFMTSPTDAIKARDNTPEHVTKLAASFRDSCTVNEDVEGCIFSQLLFQDWQKKRRDEPQIDTDKPHYTVKQLYDYNRES